VVNEYSKRAPPIQSVLSRSKSATASGDDLTASDDPTLKMMRQIAVSLLMSDRHMHLAELESLSKSMMRGEVRPVPDEKTMELLRPHARDAQHMLGIKPKS
jgi:hypothetical protein